MKQYIPQRVQSGATKLSSPARGAESHLSQQDTVKYFLVYSVLCCGPSGPRSPTTQTASYGLQLGLK